MLCYSNLNISKYIFSNQFKWCIERHYILNLFTVREKQPSSVIVTPPPPSYGSVGPPSQKDSCCWCLHKLNSAEGPCLIDRNPDILSCPNCLSPIYTRKKCVVDKSTHVAALLLLPLCVCLLPYYLNNCKSIRHHCPVCDTYIGYSI